MIHRLIMEAERRNLSNELTTRADELHMQLAHQPDAHMAFRYLERICAQLCEHHSIQIVFDQFEDLWQTAPARFFLNLRNLRDQFKYQIVYVLFTRERLQRTRNELREVEAFWELFASHIYGLGMYNQDDAYYMLDQLASRWDGTHEQST
ncbi:MAG: hypothetical protein GFH27_549287n59 [Chloroflexi bacterium AL-W]|nr:hypothetical protein [Chloroflexi bacterium AL-N1]NOK66333.1 hypothetical protein [Chloroflexi bacterium AL-N10]NOK71721.1 hypothetical protein [Chloroflexi bacterium AL-N5]NOK80978.1 hypothetical protein [Chloroflexi bacterium AL-W]NOK89251.1 hypothetical protein [Chloroflexi bacterium AL-N15]